MMSLLREHMSVVKDWVEIVFRQPRKFRNVIPSLKHEIIYMVLQARLWVAGTLHSEPGQLPLNLKN